MRIWLALMPAALLAGVIAAGTAGAGTTRPSESLARTKLVKIKLPGPAQERVTVLTLTATSHDRAVGSLKVRSPNHAELPPEIRAVAVVNPPASRRRRAKFKVYVAIRNLAAPSTAIAAGALPDIEILSAAGQGAL